MVILGGTIGNLPTSAAEDFLTSVNTEMTSGDFFLLGVQLITDHKRLEAAYNDQKGITARFNKNILRVLRNQFGAQCNPGNFDHVARFNPEAHRIEMWLRSCQAQSLDIPSLDLSIQLKKDEEIRTELSTKYDRPLAEDLLKTAGFEMVKWYTDPDRLISLALAKKP